ncbi:hypothetical protein ABBQ32_010999 [Trebouxia sp. C0010 RCD-2024]
MEQACCPYACCSSPNQPQTISHMFLECPMAATVIGWLCRLWQAVTGHLPDASVATILVASTSEGHCASDALLQTWHRLRLAVLHSIWTAARIAASSTHTSTQASQSSSQSHLASKLALKTIVSMIRHDWVKCTDDVRQLSGVCSSWLRGRDPSMTLQAFRDLWCHHDALASIHTAHTGTEDKLELVVSQSRRRRRSDRRFFEALEGCAGNAGLGPRPQYYFSIDSRSALVVTFGHLYPDKASKAAQQDVEASVMVAIREKYTSQLVAIDPQRLGTATAAYDLHFT